MSVSNGWKEHMLKTNYEHERVLWQQPHGPTALKFNSLQKGQGRVNQQASAEVHLSTICTQTFKNTDQIHTWFVTASQPAPGEE